MKAKILLTGATGTVGKAVLHQLLEKADYDISIFALPSKKNKRFLARYSQKVQAIFGDLTRREEVQQLKETYTAVIHLAAIIPPLADDRPALAKAVNTQGTLHLIEVLEKYSPQAFLLYSSSVSVYGDRLRQPNIRVGDPLLPSEGDEYAITKIAAEKAVQNSQLDWTIFRLTAIMGINNHKLSKLMFHMPLDTSMEIATPEDTARAFVKGLEKRALLSKRIFNLGGGEKCRIVYRELLEKSFAMNGLGALDFPKKTFAEKNFHCGHYADGDDLENILQFRKNDLAYYFQMNEQSIAPIQKMAASLFKVPIKYFLKRQSEPLRAYQQKDVQMMDRFF